GYPRVLVGVGGGMDAEARVDKGRFPVAKAPVAEGLMHLASPVVRVVLREKELARVAVLQTDVGDVFAIDGFIYYGFAFAASKVSSESLEEAQRAQAVEMGGEVG